MKEDVVVDARGLACPLPIIHLAKAVQRLGSGEELTLLATDPAVESDLRAWTHSTGHSLISIERISDGYRARLRKRA